jgi:predicted GNAT superfamily acetyltransferase
MFATAPDPSYAKIDGAWLTDGAYGSMHRVCVADSAKGRGVAGALFDHGFALAKAAGMPSMRIDTHGGNIPMKRALAKAGFTPCGQIILVGGCEDGDPRDAYEKIL